MRQLVSYKMLNTMGNFKTQNLLKKVVAVVCERFQLLVISVANFGVLDQWLPTRGGSQLEARLHNEIQTMKQRKVLTIDFTKALLSTSIEPRITGAVMRPNGIVTRSIHIT